MLHKIPKRTQLQNGWAPFSILFFFVFVLQNPFDKAFSTNGFATPWATLLQGWHGHQTCKFKLPPASPQAQNYNPRPRMDNIFSTEICKKVQFYIEKFGQKSSKNAKINQKLKKCKSEIKVSKSLANPIENQWVKQIQSKCKENHGNSKNQIF